MPTLPVPGVPLYEKKGKSLLSVLADHVKERPLGSWRWVTSFPGCPELLLLGADWEGSNGRMLGLQFHGLHMTPVAKQGSQEEARMQTT